MSQILQDFEDPTVPVEELEPAKRRVSDAQAAFTIHRQLREDNRLRDVRRSAVLPLNAGRKIYSDADLKSRGDGWRANLNTGTHGRKTELLESQYYDLINSVPYPAIFKCDHTDDLDMNRRYGLRVSESFKRFLYEFWGSFDAQIQLAIKEDILFGIGPVYFPDDVGFAFESLPSNTMRLPAGAPTDPTRWSLVELLYTYEVFELWDLIDTESAEKNSISLGWNPDMIKNAIMFASRSSGLRDKFNQGDWSSFEREIINNETRFSQVRSKTVHVSNLFIKEFSGKIRHMIIYNNEPLTDFMYDRETNHEEYRDFIEPLYFDAFRDFAGIRGPGEKMYDMAVHFEISYNDTLDSSRLGSSLFVTGRKRTDGRKMKWEKIMWFDEEVKFPDNPAEKAVEGSLLAQRMLEQSLDSLISVSSFATPDSKQPVSAAQVASQGSQNSIVQRSHINRFYTSLDHLYATIWKRILSSDYDKHTPGFKAREEFFDVLEKLDVPREALDACTVKAFRAVGQGSAQQLDLATRELLALSPNMLSDERRTEAHNLRVSAIFNDYGMGEHFFPIEETDIDSGSETTLISLVISHIRKGEAVAVQRNQRHTQHVTAILSFLEGAKQETQDINMLSSQFAAGLSNVASHMEIMSEIPMFARDLERLRPVFQKLVEDFKQIKASANQLNQQREAQQRAAAEAAAEEQRKQVDPKVLEVLKDAENDRLAIELKHQQNMTKEQNKTEEHILRIRADQQVDALEVQLDKGKE